MPAFASVSFWVTLAEERKAGRGRGEKEEIVRVLVGFCLNLRNLFVPLEGARAQCIAKGMRVSKSVPAQRRHRVPLKSQTLGSGLGQFLRPNCDRVAAKFHFV